MPIYEPEHVEYHIVNGNIGISMEDGRRLPAYWAHPSVGEIFPGIVLIHDWWGLTPLERHLTNIFAQLGYYSIAPDLFNGRLPTNPLEAMHLVKQLGEDVGYAQVDAALHVLETHHRSNNNVAAIGLGMGGSLAYQACLRRDDLEAAVSISGFPQRYLDDLPQRKTPLMAIYGDSDPYIKPPVIAALRKKLAQSDLPHELIILENMGRGLFSGDAPLDQHEQIKNAWSRLHLFLEKHLEKSKNPPQKGVF